MMMADLATQLTPQVQKLIKDFDDLISVSDDEAAALRSVINSSPTLINQLNTAVAGGDLRALEVLSPSASIGGSYTPSDRSLQIPVAMLKDPVEAAFLLGHESRHAINRSATTAADRRFLDDINTAAQTDRDYTDAVQQAVAAVRRDEAIANLAGWNAMVDLLHDQGRHPSLGEIAQQSWRSEHFLHRPIGVLVQVRPNLKLNQDQQFDFTPANIEGMAQNYFDQPPHKSRLGFRQNSDYANKRGAWLVGIVVQCDRHYHQGNASPMRLDLARSGLQRWLMEQNGLDFGPDDQRPMPYLDGSTNPPIHDELHHTIRSHRFVPLEEDRTRTTGQLSLASGGFTPRARLFRFRDEPTDYPSSSGGSYDWSWEQDPEADQEFSL